MIRKIVKKCKRGKNSKKGGSFLASQLFILSLLILPFAAAQASDITAGKIIELVNAERQSKNLPVLKESELLNKAARLKLEDMIKNDYFAHNSPSGVTPWVWFEKSGYDYKYAGENLAINFSSAESQHKAWMNSATHRKNILNPNYREIGLAIGKGKINGSQSTIVVQLFGTPLSAVVPESKKVMENANETAVEEVQPQIVGDETKLAHNEIEIYQERNNEYSLMSSGHDLSQMQINESSCGKGLCYLGKSDEIMPASPLNHYDNYARMIVMIVIFLSVSINVFNLCRRYRGSPFIGANTAVLFLILAMLAFLQK